MSHTLDSLQDFIIGDYVADNYGGMLKWDTRSLDPKPKIIGDIKENTRTLDYGSYATPGTPTGLRGPP